eukprot:10488509-Alexandrium_andersonii.AAC.1
MRFGLVGNGDMIAKMLVVRHNRQLVRDTVNLETNDRRLLSEQLLANGPGATAEDEGKDSRFPRTKVDGEAIRPKDAHDDLPSALQLG